MSLARYVPSLCLVVSLLTPEPAISQIAAVVPQGSVQSTTTLNRLIGLEFHVSRPVTLVDLGRLDINGNGTLDDLAAPELGLWDATGNLLRSTMLSLSSTAEAGAFYGAVEPLELAPGNYVVGTQTFRGGEPVHFMSSPVRLLAGIDWVQGRYNTANTFAFPSRRGFLSIAPTFRLDQPVLLNSPARGSVLQRDGDNQAMVPLQGLVDPRADKVEARIIDPHGNSSPWTLLDLAAHQFTGQLAGTGGWNQVEVRAYQGDQLLGHDLVDRIGVGEIFVTAGQSNSANHGAPLQTPQTDNVVAMTEGGFWQPAKDPQPIATGTGGSPWPSLGDQLSTRWGVPIGFVSVGWGGTRVDEWLPGGSLYPRLQQALQRLGPNGARAVLWHQGESDALNSTSTTDYAARLQQVIQASRHDAGFDIPWGVALAAYLPQNTPQQNQAVVAGQHQVIDLDPLTFLGPNTEELVGPQWRYDQVHFNTAGLQEHARRWADALERASLVPEPTYVGWWGVSLAMWARRRDRTRHI